MSTDLVSLSVGITVPFVIICVLSFCIRIHARTSIDGPLGKEDWVMVLAFVAWLVEQAIIYEWVHLGAGRHQSGVPDDKIDLMQRYLFAGEFLYHFAQFLIKQSFCLFYLRFLGTTAWRYVIILTMCLTGVQVCGTWIFYGLQCIPSHAPLNPDMYPHATCLGTGFAYYAPSVANIVIDLIIYILPIQPLLTQPLSVERQIRMALVMILGGCTILISALRFVVLHQIATRPDFTYILGRVVIVTTFEFVLAIVTANIPTMSLAYQHHFGRHKAPNNWEQELRNTRRHIDGNNRSSALFSFRKPGLDAIPITRNNASVVAGSGAISPAFDRCNSPTDSESDLVKEPRVLVTSKWEVKEEDASRRERSTPSPRGFRLRSDV